MASLSPSLFPTPLQQIGYPLYAQPCITDDDCFQALDISEANKKVTCCMRLETKKHRVLDSFYYEMGENYLNALADFSKHGYPGQVGQYNHVCNTNYPLAVKKRDAPWVDGKWPSYARTIYSTNPPYAASIM